MAALLALLFRQRFHELYLTWLGDDNYSHGFFVPVISGWIAWQVCRAQGWPASGGSRWWLAVIAMGCLLHLYDVLDWSPPKCYLALVAILYGLALVVGGPAWARGFRFPIAFLFFMFPLPAALVTRWAVWLQDVVAMLAANVLELFLPVHREGNVLYLPGQQLEVGEACSGLRQIILFVALAFVVAHYMARWSWGGKVALILGALPVAVITNLFRILLMAFALRHFGPQSIEGAYHQVPGLLTLPIGLALFLGVGWWLFHLVPPAGRSPQSAEGLAASSRDAACVAPFSPSLFVRLGAALVCLGLTLAGQWSLLAHVESVQAQTAPELRQALTGFPVSLEGWLGKDLPSTTLPFYAAADDKLDRTYVRGELGDPITCHLWMVHYRDGSDRQHHPLICYQVAGFTEQPSARETLMVGTGKVERFGFTRGEVKSYVYYWHYTFEPPVRSEASWLQALYQRRMQRWPSLTIEVFTSGDADGHLAEVAGFVRAVDAQIQGFVPRGAKMGSDILPIRYTGAPRIGPTR